MGKIAQLKISNLIFKTEENKNKFMNNPNFFKLKKGKIDESTLLEKLDKIAESEQAPFDSQPNRLILSQRVVHLIGLADKEAARSPYPGLCQYQMMFEFLSITYSEVYTVPELYSMIKFYSSPIGSQIAEKLPEIDSKSLKF